MRELPIPFTTEMVKAILEGRKTQTRRVIKPQPKIIHAQYTDGSIETEILFHSGRSDQRIYPRYQVGDRLWCKHRYDLFDTYYLQIAGYNGQYYAGTDGHIYRNGEQLKEVPNEKGYLLVTPSVNNHKETRTVHQLIAQTFYPEHKGYDQVRHMDGNNQNNLPQNLDWGTAEDNWHDRKCHGRGMGEEHHSAKLTKRQVKEIRESKKSQRQLAKIYHVSQASIWAVRNQITWDNHTLRQCRNLPIWKPWESSLFMPKKYARLWLEVTGVRAERLADISEEDAKAEGIADGGCTKCGSYEAEHPVNKTGYPWYPCEIATPDYIDAFIYLWDSINPKYPWSLNPYVWVYEFKVER